jgi:hypothetical protein
MAWTTWHDPDGNIRVRIEGYLGTEDGEQTMQSIIELLGPTPRDLIFEVSAMAGYRRGVRAAWQASLQEHRGQLRRVVLVGGNSVVRMGLSVISMSLGIPLVVHEGDAPAEPDAPVRRARAGSRSRPSSRPISRPMLGAVSEPTRRERSLAMRRSREDSRPNH